ncbi:MAG: YceI family protein [Calditrichaeota bacterium]|nr:YceI family protein [Calditrichota bacterium]
MKTKTLAAHLLGLVFLLGQTSYKVDNSKSKLTIDGTSTLHDWTSVAEQVSGDASIQFDNNSIKINNLKFQVLVSSIKSGKEGMDENTWEELKYEDYPNIQYELVSVGKVTPTDSGFALETKGALQVAGKSQVIQMTVTAMQMENQLSFSGEKALKMTDFEIDPPTMFLGTIRTGDDITIKFKVLFNKEM